MTVDSVLVTGGAGFIGSTITERLVEAGVETFVVDDLSTGAEGNVPAGATFIEGNLADPETYDRLDECTHVDAVLHLAGQSSGEASFDDPTADFESHAVSTFELLQWCEMNGIDRLLYGSSMSVYGDHEYLPVDESHPVDPKTYYAAGKLSAEAYVKLHDNLGMDTTVFRMFSVYGPGQDLDNRKQGMVSIYLSFLVADEELVVKGSFDRFRDFVYVGDVVDAWIEAIDEPATYGETYNLGRGEKVTVEELVETMIDRWGVNDYPVHRAEGTPGDQFGIYGNISKLRSDLDGSIESAEGIGIQCFTACSTL